jgi:microcystin-dependent protein
MSNPYIGEIRMFAGNFAPDGWALCDGRAMDIADNEALYTLIGTTYGGDGDRSFLLPDLRGKAPMHRSVELPLGTDLPLAARQEGSALKTPSTLAVNFIISLFGIYPSA